MRVLRFTRGNLLLIAMVAVTLLPLIVITLLSYKHSKEITIEEYLTNLSAVNASRVANINQFVHHRMEQVILLTGFIESLGEQALYNPQKISQLQHYLDNSLKALQNRKILKNKNVTSESAQLTIVVRKIFLQ